MMAVYPLYVMAKYRDRLEIPVLLRQRSIWPLCPDVGDETFSLDHRAYQYICVENKSVPLTHPEAGQQFPALLLAHPPFH
jgi:hypothetical protein